MDKSDKISIHAPHEGERLNVSRDKAKNWRAFQSTLPARGSDSMMSCVSASLGRFQSTLPARGSDNQAIITGLVALIFQSTLPARGSDDLLLSGATE